MINQLKKSKVLLLVLLGIGVILFISVTKDNTSTSSTKGSTYFANTRASSFDTSELQSQIHSLETRVDDLESENQDLRSQVSDLEGRLSKLERNIDDFVSCLRIWSIGSGPMEKDDIWHCVTLAF